MKKIVLIFLLLLAAVIIFEAADKSKPKDMIVFRGEKKGDVTFNHMKHTQHLDSKCTDCHHKSEPIDNYKSCRSCHGIRTDIDKPIKIFHKVCFECHKSQKANLKAPKKCKDCHSKID